MPTLKSYFLNKNYILYYNLNNTSNYTIKIYCMIDQEVSRRDIVNAIILHGYPLNILNHYGLQKFIRGLQPMFKMVTRKTIKKDILNIYDSEKDKLFCLLEKLDCRVAITTNIWIAKQTKKSYMAVTAHYINEAWVPQSRLLRQVLQFLILKI